VSKQTIGVGTDARSDLELIRASGTEIEAFAELVRRHQDFVFGAALRIVKNRAMAEEVAQEAFIRAYRGATGFRGDAQVRSWLYRIATNLALNAVTRQKEFPTDEIPEEIHTIGPAHDAEMSELREAMLAAIDELPPKLREPLVLREMDGLSYEEIAARTDTPLNTVRTRILRARRALADKMEEWR
jgi:RNA polymerase sigma-70 factor (ECF subfamily)